jgi:ABC-type phosphate transport system substrate-binding protein
MMRRLLSESTLFALAATVAAAFLLTACGNDESTPGNSTPEVSTTVSLAPSTTTFPTP